MKQKPKKNRKPKRDLADIPLTDKEMAAGKWMYGINELPPKARDAVRRMVGRPRVAAPKRVKSFKLSPDLITAIMASGKGYNARVEAALRRALTKGWI